MSRERRAINCICVFAVARVSLYLIAFPFATNVDEFHHYDAVVKFSKTIFISREEEFFDAETIETFALIYSPEYAAAAPEAVPPLKQSQEVQQQEFQKHSGYLQVRSHESQQPPVYYMLAGAFRKLGATLGMPLWALYFWTKLLNIMIFLGFVWTSYRIARLVSEDLLVRTGVPLLVAAIPQDSFYMVTNDALHPLFFAGALFFSLKIALSNQIQLREYAWLGLCAALAFLTKFSTCGLLVLPVLLVWFKREQVPKQLAWSYFAPAILMGAYFLRNLVFLGSWNGAMEGFWKLKPISQFLPHPLFSFEGTWFFWKRLVPSFWRGEVIWHGQWIYHAYVDYFYMLITLLALIGACLFAVSRQHSKPMKTVLLWSLLAPIFFLVFCSVAYDFGEWFYPSRKRPYLVSGRLIYGAVIPGAIFFLATMKRISGEREKITIAALAVITLVCILSELILSWAVFPSPFNGFHLPW